MSTQMETLNAEIRRAEALHHQAVQEFVKAKTGNDAKRRELAIRNERQTRDLLENLYEQKGQVQPASAYQQDDNDPPLSEKELRIYEQAFQAGHAAGRLEARLSHLRILGEIITD